MSTNRIAGYLDEIAIARTEAQATASRVNGAKSRGPKTAAGKARSRQNALKHGLLCRVLDPGVDARGHSRVYRKIREGLVQQFRPTTFTEMAEIDSLAADYLRAARAREMLTAVYDVDRLNEAAEKRIAQARTLDKETRLLRRIRSEVESGKNPACTQEEAAIVGRLVAGEVRHIKESADEEGAWLKEEQGKQDLMDAGLEPYDPKAEDWIEESTRESYDERRAFLDVFGDALETFQNESALTRLLCDGQMLSPEDRRRFVAALGKTMVLDRQRPTAGRKALDATRSNRNQALANLADDPAHLERLEEYVCRLDRTIARKLRRLQR